MRLICIRILPIISVLTLLCSCADNVKKETAYCFSAVLENCEGRPRIALYCKIPASDGAEGNEEKNAVLTFDGFDFYDAFNKIDDSDREAYFDSLCAVYIADNVTDKQVLDIARIIFGNSAYNTSFSVYNPSSESATTIEILRELASEVCNGEAIPKTGRKDYVKAVEYFRKRTFGGGTV